MMPQALQHPRYAASALAAMSRASSSQVVQLRVLPRSQPAVRRRRKDRQIEQLLDIMRAQSEQLRALTTWLLETRQDTQLALTGTLPEPDGSSASARAAAQPKLVSMSRRQREMLDLIGTGMSPGEIARIMHISLSTVYTHRVNLLEKLDLRNPSELMRFALEHRAGI